MKSALKTKARATAPATAITGIAGAVTSIQAERMKRSMHAYVRGAWTVLEPRRHFVDNWHIGNVCEHLEAAKRRELKFLVVNVPPGSMKSLIVNVMFPSWTWIDEPHARFLCIGASDALPTRDSLKCRRLIESAWYRERWGHVYSLSSDQNAKTKYENTKTGVRSIGSFAGTIMGERAGYILIDDPHKTDLAESDEVREGKLVKFREEIYGRREDEHSVIVIIMQRLNERDLSGYVLAEGWADAHVCIPMRHEMRRKLYSLGANYKVKPENADPRKKKDELMCPERFPEAEVKKTEKVLGSFGTAGQLQQRPSPRGGGIVKRADFRFYRQAELQGLVASFDLIYDSWDMAFKDLDTSSYVVGQKWGRIGVKKYLIKQVRDRMSFSKSCVALEDLARWLAPHGILVEDKANGPAIMDALRNKVSGIIAIEPMGSKYARAEAASPQYEAHEVYVPDPDESGSEWAESFISEWCAIPGNAFWDQVDAGGQALLKMRGAISKAGFSVGVMVGAQLESQRDYLGGIKNDGT